MCLAQYLLDVVIGERSASFIKQIKRFGFTIAVTRQNGPTWRYFSTLGPHFLTNSSIYSSVVGQPHAESQSGPKMLAGFILWFPQRRLRIVVEQNNEQRKESVVLIFFEHFEEDSGLHTIPVLTFYLCFHYVWVSRITVLCVCPYSTPLFLAPGECHLQNRRHKVSVPCFNEMPNLKHLSDWLQSYQIMPCVGRRMWCHVCFEVRARWYTNKAFQK